MAKVISYNFTLNTNYEFPDFEGTQRQNQKRFRLVQAGQLYPDESGFPDVRRNGKENESKVESGLMST
jgi:hypothetical protein